MSKTTEAISLPLDQIKNKFDVRVALDQDRVIQFAGLYEGGIELPPIEVVRLADDEYAFIDGRHRAAARQYLNLTNVMAVVRNGNLKDNPGALFALALQANWGGAQPPTRNDIQHTVLRMLEAGVSRKDIESVLSFIPRGSLRSYTAHALNRMNRRHIGVALDAIREGLPIEKAAARASVKLETLKDVIAGKKGKWGRNRTDENQHIIDLKVYISQSLRSANTGIGKKITDLLLKVSDGEISAKGAAIVIKAYREHIRKTGLNITDWESRLNNLATHDPKPVVVTPEPMQEAKPKTQRTAPARPKSKPEVNPKEYKGTRMPPGFWNEELPKAIRITKAKQATPLVEYFAKNGRTFTFKQVDSALQRLRQRGMA